MAAHGRSPRGVGGGGRAGAPRAGLVRGAGRRRAARDALRMPGAVRGAPAPALGAAGASSGRAGRSSGPAASPLQPAGRAPGVSSAGCCRRTPGPNCGLCRDGQRVLPLILPAPLGALSGRILTSGAVPKCRGGDGDLPSGVMLSLVLQGSLAKLRRTGVLCRLVMFYRKAAAEKLRECQLITPNVVSVVLFL